MRCFFRHKFIKLDGEVLCERCGLLWADSQKSIKKDFLGRIQKAQVIKREDNIDEILKS